MRLVKLGTDYIDPESIEALDVVTGFVEGPRTRVSVKSGGSFTVRESVEDVIRKIHKDEEVSATVRFFARLPAAAFLVSGALWFWGIIG